jgi:hypothetical protein
MKTALYGLMLSALLAAGCIPKAPFTWPDDSAAPAEDVDLGARKHVGAVRADQVTPENAAQKARELEAELDSDSRAPLPTTEVPSKK